MSDEELSTLRINLDLETGPFKKNLQTVKAGMTALKGEYNNLTQFNKKYQNSLEGLQANSTRLTKTMDLQKQRIQLLKDEYKDLSGRLGENSQEALKMRSAYENAQGRLKQMETELANTNKRIQEQGSEWAKVSTATDKTVKSMESQLNVLNSDYKVLTAGVKDFGSKTADLQLQSSHLTKTLELESSSVDALRKKYDEAVKSKGKDAQETQAAKIAMNEAIVSMKNTESELSKVNSKITFQTSSWGKLNSKLEDYKKKAGDVSEKAKSVGDGITGAFGPATAVMSAGLGVAAVKAMDFEQEMSNVKSVMSPDDVKNYGDELSKLAITMGAKTKYSATEAAQAIGELEKAGVSTTDIIHGGLSGALSLATAGELDLKDAAEIASTALNSFRKDNISVSRAADILAGAANASATDVSELKFSLSMVSAVASGVGLSFEDTSTALAELAQNGLKGSDAGTSLKTMLLNLTPSTTQAANMMAELGLMTKNNTVAYQWLVDRGMKPASESTKDVSTALEKLAKIEVGAKASKAKLAKEYQTLAKYSGLTSSAFYDQNGKLKSLSDISGTLSSHLSDLSEEQRQVALKTMFGTDAIRASNILYEEGAKGAKDMDAAINKVTANEVAAQKMDNLKGSIENLKGSLETAAITIGNALIPDIKSLTSEVQHGVDWFNSLSDTQKRLIIDTAKWGTVILGTFTTLGLGLKVVGSAIGGFKMFMGAASTAIKWLAPMEEATAGVGEAAVGTEAAMTGVSAAVGTSTATLGAASLGATGLAASLEIMAGPVGWAALGLTAAGVAAYKFNENMKKPVMTVDLFNNKISEGTKKAIGSYMNMNNKVTEQLNLMNLSGQAVSKDMASKITAEFQDMGGVITQSLDKDYNKNFNNLKQFFASAKGLSAKDKADTLQAVQAKYNEQKGYVTKGEAQIKAIMQKASSEHRQLTNEEKSQINIIQANMEAVAVRTLSKGAAEQRTIFSELQSQNGKITAQQAADTVANSKKATNEAIKDANKRYDSVVATLNHEYYDLHAISKQQMDDGIKAAQKERDGSVKAAQDMQKKVVAAAKAQAGDHANEIDWETGKVKDGWQKMWDNVSGFWTKIENFLGFGKSSSKSKSSGNSGGGGSHGGSLHAAAYAKGTNSFGHPGGPAIVGERGPELAKIPGVGYQLLGTQGSTLIPNLPRGSAVLPNKQTEGLLKSFGFPGYADGIGSFIGEVFTNPSKFIDDALGASKITDGLLPSFFTQALGGSPAKAIGSMMLNGVKGLFSQITSNIGGGMSGQVKNWVTTAMAITGVPMNYLGSLLGLVQHESGGNPSAINLWDSNAKAGHPSKGLFQTIDSTFSKYALPGLGDIWNPIANAIAGIRYGLATYGSIGNIPGIKAMASGGSYVGYASGAYGISNPQLAWLAEGGHPESVISFDPKLKARSQAIWQQTGQTLGFNADTKAQTSLLEELVDLIKQLLSQDKNVYMDGKKVNSILTNLTKQQETNRNIAKGIQMI